MRLFILSIFWLLSFSLQAEVGYNIPWGKDSDLQTTQATSDYTLSPAGKIAEHVILFHQNVLSKVDGPRSHFRPTSSRYMLLAIRKHGFLKGFILGCDRLMRENDDPWIYRTIEIDGKRYKYNPTPPK